MNKRNIQIEKIFKNFHAIKRMIAFEKQCMNNNFGMTVTQAMVLFMLKNKKEMNVTEIANMLGVTKSAATQLIDGLIKNKFVIREVDDIDRRIFRIKPSNKGVKYLENTRKKAFDKIFTFFEILSETEIKQLNIITTKLLKKIKENNR